MKLGLKLKRFFYRKFVKPAITKLYQKEDTLTDYPNVIPATVNSPTRFDIPMHMIEYAEQGKPVNLMNRSTIFPILSCVKNIHRGYEKLEKKYGIEIVNLETAERVTRSWKYGELDLPSYLETHEYINVPAMKTHIQCTVTLGLKNQKGLLKLTDKKKFHQTDLNGMIRELATIAVPDLVVMDAIYCCEATGPAVVGSKPKKMDLLIAGTDIIEVDNVSAQIMGFDPTEIPHIPKRTDIDVRGLSIEEVQSPFEPPEPYLTIKNIRAYSDTKACTSCTINLSRAMQKIFFTPELQVALETKGEIDLLMGTHPLPNTPSPTVICMGKCAKETAERDELPLIKGCPPSYRALINFLFDNYYEKQKESQN